jgi:hypothetical protein
MSNPKSLMSMLTSMHWDDQVKFAEALETIKSAAAMLSRPEVVSCLAFLRETAHAASSMQSALQGELAATGPIPADSAAATMLFETVSAVALDDALKAIAVQDPTKAAAIQFAVKNLALREAARAERFSEEEIRAIVSDEAAHAITMLRHAQSTQQLMGDRRSKQDRRKAH